MSNLPNHPIIFEDYDLSSLDGVTIYNYNIDELPDRDMKYAKLARVDKSVLTSAEYSDKRISIKASICGDTYQDRQYNLTRLKGRVQVANGRIIVNQAGFNISYNATLEAVQKRYYGETIDTTFTFLCADPIGKETTTTQMLSVNNTGSSSIYSVTNQGSFLALPKTTVTINSLTDGTGAKIVITNANSGQGIEVTRDWVAGEVLVVDSDLKEVTVDNVAVEYVGIFPTFLPDLRIFGYLDDFTARDVDILVTYNKRFI